MTDSKLREQQIKSIQQQMAPKQRGHLQRQGKGNADDKM
jgi:hypothetical protein